jgi:hypothetical protein
MTKSFRLARATALVFVVLLCYGCPLKEHYTIWDVDGKFSYFPGFNFGELEVVPVGGTVSLKNGHRVIYIQLRLYNTDSTRSKVFRFSSLLIGGKTDSFYFSRVHSLPKLTVPDSLTILANNKSEVVIPLVGQALYSKDSYKQANRSDTLRLFSIAEPWRGLGLKYIGD